MLGLVTKDYFLKKNTVLNDKFDSLVVWLKVNKLKKPNNSEALWEWSSPIAVLDVIPSSAIFPLVAM